MLHTLVNIIDAGQNYCLDASNAARYFIPYFTLTIKILLSLRRPEKKFNRASTSSIYQKLYFHRKKKVKTKQKTLSGVIENIRNLKPSEFLI